jgi:CRP-like cAMP-binding protein
LKTLISKIKESIDLSSEAEAYLMSVTKEKTIPKETVLIRQGDLVKKSYFVKSGCLRAYHINKHGKECTLQFAIKGWWISDYIAIHSHELAHLTVECLSESEVIEFNVKDLNDALLRFPEFEPFQRNNLEQHVISLQKRILNHLSLSAAERYDVFIKQYGDIEKNTKNYHIASYLGITQESLSRIRVNKSKK